MVGLLIPPSCSQVGRRTCLSLPSGLREPQAKQLHWAQGQEQRTGCLQGTRGPRKVLPSSGARGPRQRRPVGPAHVEGTAYHAVHSTAQEGHTGPAEEGPWDLLWRGPHVTQRTAQLEAAGPGSQEDARRCGDLRAHAPGSFKYQPGEGPAYVLLLCVASSLLGAPAGKSWAQ